MDKKKAAFAIKKTTNRAYHAVMGTSGKLMPWPKPEIISGAGSINRLPEMIRKRGISKVMIVTDKGVYPHVETKVIPMLEKAGIGYEIYDAVFPNPTDTVCLEVAEKYKAAACDGMLAVGGGSPIDAAKGALVNLKRPLFKLEQLAGIFTVLAKIPPLIAVPTTSGSGSEVSLAAVIVAEHNRHKFVISDPCIIPKAAILDPDLMVTMPDEITATTGMDALTHAIESYLTFAYGTDQTKRDAEEAVVKVFRHLEKAVADGSDVAEREQMAIAACKAGQAFGRTGLGHVHAISHAISGAYDTAHGLANSVILPIVLEDYGPAVYPRLAHLAEITGVMTLGSEADKARSFIRAIRDLNKRLGLPTGFDFLREEDFSTIAKWAVKEGNGAHPSPVVYDEARVRHILNRIKGEA